MQLEPLLPFVGVMAVVVMVVVVMMCLVRK